MEYIKLIVTLTIMITLLILGFIWLTKRAVKVSTELSRIENKVYDATTPLELENALDDLKKVPTFHKSHYYRCDKIIALIKLKMQYVNKPTDDKN